MWYNITMGYDQLISNKRILSIIAVFLLFSLISKSYYEINGTNVFANDSYPNSSLTSKNVSNDIEELVTETGSIGDGASIDESLLIKKDKIRKVEKYLNGRNSPLAKYAEEFVEAADHYNIDYRLVAAISIIESGGGKHNFRPHNAWGWGRRSFNSWEEGIWEVSRGLSVYYSRGMDTPSKIAPRYCPPNAEKWASNVTYVMNLIESK